MVVSRRGESLSALLRERILVLDGATGTQLQRHHLSAEDYGGEEFEGCPEQLLFTRPDLISQLHRSYLKAGADIIETNTFGATPVVLEEYHLAEKTRELNRLAASVASKECEAFSTEDQPRFVAGSMGPTTKTLSLTGGISFGELAEGYRLQAAGLMEGGADYLLVETAQDILNVKAAFVGISSARKELGAEIPVAFSCTVETTGTLLAGQDVESFAISVAHAKPLYIGLNCALGPHAMADHLRDLATTVPCPVAVVPNAGLPDSEGCYRLGPEELAKDLANFARHGWVNVVGGCCGTGPDHIRALASMAKEATPRSWPEHSPRRGWVAGLTAQDTRQERPPLLIGERTNAIGSQSFRALIHENRFAEAAEIGRRQSRGGAQILDVCLADPERDEKDDMSSLLAPLRRMVRLPFMLDSTDADVLKVALENTPGKPILNSVNFEDGGKRLHRVLGLAQLYGASLVAGTIDEDPSEGMALTAHRKLEIAERLYQTLVVEGGLPKEDLLFDPLVFPAATGDRQYAGSAMATIEGVRDIARRFPHCGIVLGISNVSFGLPKGGRETLNSVFLHLCVEAGLTGAIVNTEHLIRYPDISPREKELALTLLRRGNQEDISAFADYFRKKKETPTHRDEILEMSPEKALSTLVLRGERSHLVSILETLLTTFTPMEIINGPLMEGMAEVGRLFGKNQLIVAEVLQSAEVMKAAVDHLRPLLESNNKSPSSRGKIVLATVKGDVHDIGKNLVGILLESNGFEVIDLGIKIPPGTLVDAIQKYRPDFVGLSGLLVRSAHMMVETVTTLQESGIKTPLLVGGAALSKRFTEKRIGPAYGAPVAYASSAMNGLDLALHWESKGPGEDVSSSLSLEIPPTPIVKTKSKGSPPPTPDPLPRAPDYEIHPFHPPLTLLTQWVNRQMLLGKHLGLRGSVARQLAKRDEVAMEVQRAVDQLLDKIVALDWMAPKGLFRFLPAWREGDDVRLGPTDAKEGPSFHFIREPSGKLRCAADWVAQKKEGDTVGLLVCTAGEGVAERAHDLREKGNFLEAFAFQALALDLAEGLAEMVHSQMRALWGFSDPKDMPMADRFRAKYRGIRLSFGYPACPDLSQQGPLLSLLEAQRIGIQLTDGDMMEPEASVSAVVFHHPRAAYYGGGSPLA